MRVNDFRKGFRRQVPDDSKLAQDSQDNIQASEGYKMSAIYKCSQGFGSNILIATDF